MPKSVEKIFLIQVLLFAVSIFTVSVAEFFLIYKVNVERSVNNDFMNDVRFMAGELSYKVKIAEENVKALSSRTMIRKKLFDYHNGEASIEEVRSFSQSKFADGASVYEEILYAVRYDDKGAVIAVFEDFKPGEERSSDGDFVFFKTGQGCSVLIRKSIIHDGVVIGTDEAAFLVRAADDELLPTLNSVCVKQAGSELGEEKISYTYPIGDTGYVLYAELNDDVRKRELRNTISDVIIYAVATFLVLILISYFTILRMTFDLIRNLDRSVKERQLLFDELQHRIKNNLNFIISYISLQEVGCDEPALLERNEKLIKKIEAISLAYDMLQRGRDIAELNVSEYLVDLCRTVAESGDHDGIEIRPEIEEEVVITSKKAITLGLIYSELIVNSVKHAKTETRLLITVGTARRENEYVFIYSDNGKPYPENFDMKKSESLGLLVITSLVEQLNGRLETDFQNSKTVKIIIPQS